MQSTLVIFAGPICLNPNTERESFVWGLVIGGVLLGLLSAVFGLAALVVAIRHTLNPGRRLWAKRYGLSLLAFFFIMGLGWLVGTGGTRDDYCRTADSSLQGSMLAFLAVTAGFWALISLLGFMFSFTKNSTGNKV